MSDNENLREENEALKERIRQLEIQLAKTQQLTAIGELASTTTHEFNNILTMILNYATMGIRHKDMETRDKSFNKIYESATRAARITKTVLGLARNRKPGREPTDVVSLMDDVLLLLEKEMNKYKIQVEKDFRSVPEIMVNGNQIQQVFVNLLINARQAMPEGGRLVLKITLDESAGFVDIFIRDHGTGIPQDKLPHIFDSFYTTKNGPDESGKGGTGLGLSLCKNIIEAHEGRIRVESSVGVGTAFTLRLPVAKEK